MSGNKLISKKKLNEFYKILIDIYNYSLSYDGKIQDKLLYLIDTYKKDILEKDKEDLNDLKRKVYLDMKNSENEEDRNKLYQLYQLLKQK